MYKYVFYFHLVLKFEILYQTLLRKLCPREQTDLRELSGIWTQVLTIPPGEPADNRARRPGFFIYFPTAVISNYFNGKLDVCNCTARRKKGPETSKLVREIFLVFHPKNTALEMS